MKNRLISAALVAASAVCATSAFAQTAQQDINISATVAGYCRISGAATPAALNATVPVSTVGVVDTTDIPFTIPGVVCNTAADLRAASQSGGVKSGASVTAGFSNIINYTGEAKLGTTTSTINTATTTTAIGVEQGNIAPTSGAYTGDLNIKITPQSATDPLVAGSYSDTMRVTITPIP